MERLGIGLFICLGCWGCGQLQPSAPSLAAVAGIYNFTVTRCSLCGESADLVVDFPPFESSTIVPGRGSGTAWTLAQVGSDMSGTTSGEVPPFGWSGSLTGTVVSATKIEITTLTYRDSSSHGGLHTFSGTGSGVVDSTGISGALAGDFALTPTFGGFVGTTTTCHGAQMPFRFSTTR